MRIWDYARTAQQINANKDVTTASTSSSLRLNLPLHGETVNVSGKIFQKDLSSYGNHVNAPITYEACPTQAPTPTPTPTSVPTPFPEGECPPANLSMCLYNIIRITGYGNINYFLDTYVNFSGEGVAAFASNYPLFLERNEFTLESWFKIATRGPRYVC